MDEKLRNHPNSSTARGTCSGKEGQFRFGTENHPGTRIVRERKWSGGWCSVLLVEGRGSEGVGGLPSDSSPRGPAPICTYRSGEKELVRTNHPLPSRKQTSSGSTSAKSVRRSIRASRKLGVFRKLGKAGLRRHQRPMNYISITERSAC